jgi:hypothetical protein
MGRGTVIPCTVLRCDSSTKSEAALPNEQQPGGQPGAQPAAKLVADDTCMKIAKKVELEGATGTITLVVDPVADKYYVVRDLLLSESTFDILAE